MRGRSRQQVWIQQTMPPCAVGLSGVRVSAPSRLLFFFFCRFHYENDLFINSAIFF
jgi:hypothetical protein